MEQVEPVERFEVHMELHRYVDPQFGKNGGGEG